MDKRHELTTRIAREKFARAHALGVPVPKITHVGWGDGGVDVDGNLVLPADTVSEVPGEFIRKPIDTATHDGLTATFLLTLLGTDTNAVGKALSSCGLYDEDGDLLAVACFSVKTVNENSRIEIKWNEVF